MREKRKLFSSLWDLPYGSTTPHNLFDTTKNSKELVQKLQLQRKIPVHNGCVNSICWNETGKYLLSGSDDQHLSIVHGYDYSVLAYIPTGHRANIFSAKFLPNTDDKNVVSCSGDGLIIYSHIERPETSLHSKFACHKGTAYEIMTVPNDPNTFLSCGEDRTVRWFDVRTKTSCNKADCQDDILIHCQSPVTSLAVNPYTPYQLAVGCGDASVRMFDRRMLCTQNASGFSGGNGFEALMSCFTVPEFTQSRRITSLGYSADGQEMLVSYSSDYIYLFDIRDDLNKKPRHLSFDGSLSEADSDPGLYFRGKPLMKRLRIRGDWSDTGPNARPEAETRVMQLSSTAEGEESNASRTTIVRTMTDILTRMFHTGNNRNTENNRIAESAATESAATESAASESAASESAPPSSQASYPSEERALESDNEDISHTTRNEESKTVLTDVDSGNACNPSTSHFDQLSQPSTSGTASQPDEKKDDLGKCFKKLSRNNVNSKKELHEASNTCSIKREIERRRNLFNRPPTEHVVNLHYSGQGASSGQIRMDVANTQLANERHWLQQSVAHLPTNTDGVYTEEQELISEQNLERAILQTRADREAGVQTIVPNEGLPIIVRSSADSSTAQAERSGDGEDGRMEMLMEVDTWEDSDDEATTRESQGASSTSHFMDSLKDEVKAANDELRKVETHMSSVCQPRIKRKYTGHRNARTMIKESTFWGDNFIMSGSDCGHIFIWDRHTTELVMLMEADHHVVNCLQPHPFDPILASSGIDYDIKLWAPSREEPFFDVQKANEIIKRNEIMLEETKDTITVPASFMFRMFTTLNHFRTGRAYRWSRAAREMRAANSDANER